MAYNLRGKWDFLSHGWWINSLQAWTCSHLGLHSRKWTKRYIQSKLELCLSMQKLVQRCYLAIKTSKKNSNIRAKGLAESHNSGRRNFVPSKLYNGTMHWIRSCFISSDKLLMHAKFIRNPPNLYYRWRMQLCKPVIERFRASSVASIYHWNCNSYC